MNELRKIIYDRRAVRKYKDWPIDKDIIEQLIDAGRMAPSGMNYQPWKFYVVMEHELINRMDDAIRRTVEKIYTLPHMVDFLKTRNPIFHGAPVVVFIAAPKENEWAALDIGMCAQNMMLSAKAVGLDTCPIGLAKFIDRTSLYSLLEIPSSDQVALALTIGYGDESPPVHERRKDNVFYIREALLSAHRVQ